MGTDVTVTSGSIITPYKSGASDARTQYLVLASELQALGMPVGMINNIGFNVATASTVSMTGFTIKMGTTTINQTTTTFQTPLTTVFTGTYTATSGWNTHNLTTPIMWNGVDNLIIEVCFGNSNYSVDSQVYYSSKTFTCVTEGYDWYLGNGCTVTSYGNQATRIARPNIKFGITASPNCSGTPVAGNTSGLSTVCQHQNFTLSLSGNTPQNGLSYQWQSGPSISGPWSNVPNGQFPSVTVSQTQNTFYRCEITCVSTSQTSSSTPLSVNTNLNLPSGTYTIGSGGNYPNFTAAVAALACGIAGPVTFNVIPSSPTFNERISIPEIYNSSSVNKVIFNGNGNTISSATTITNNYIIRLDGADNVAFNNLNIVTTSATYANGVYITNNSDYNLISNCNIDLTSTIANTGSTNAGIVISGSTSSSIVAGNSGTNNIILNTNIKGGYYGITMFGMDKSLHSNGNMINNCIIEDFYFYGIYLSNISNSIISKNIIRRPTRVTVSTFYGIFHSISGSNNLIDGNKIHDAFTGVNPPNTSASYPIFHSDVDASLGNENRVTNNIIYNMNNNGTCYAIYNSGSDHIKYLHNTVSLDYAASTAGATRGFFQTAVATGVEFKNNIISVTRGGTGIKYCLYFATTTSSISCNNNVLYLNAPSGTNSYGYYLANQPTLAAWQAVNSGAYDQNSVSANPMFTNPAAGLFIPFNTAVNDIGAPLGVLSDIAGNPRSTTSPDPGAYEFSPGPNDAGITALITPLNGVTPPGIQPIEVRMTNFGLANLASVSISGYITNGTTTANFGPIAYSGAPLSTLGTATIQLGSFNFVSGPYTLVAWTSNPNNNTDGNLLNDTMTTSICIGISGTYTIGAGGNYTTFGAAVAALSCGVTGPVVFNVLANASPYNEQVTIPVINNASSTNTITFNGNANTLSFAPTTTNRYVIMLNGADYVTINNLIIKSTVATNSFGVLLTNDADFNTINNCTVDLTATLTNTGTTNAGIVISGSTTSATTAGASGTNNQIMNTKIIGGYYGITIFGNSTSVNSLGNTIGNCTIEDFYNYGIYVAYVSNNSIVNNIIKRPTRASVGSFIGLYHATSGQNNIVAFNKFHDAYTGVVGANTLASYPIYHNSVDATVGFENKVYNNLIYNINNNGTIYGIYNVGCDHIQYHHNTISLDHAPSTAGITVGFYQTTLAVGVDFRNNVISITRGGTGLKHCLYFATTTSTIVSNRNVLYINPPAGLFGIGYYSATATTLANWKAVNSAAYDQNSVDNDPMFLSPATSVYSPTNIAVNNIGDPLGITLDINGAPRSATSPDPGAYEFTPAGNDAGISALITPVNGVTSPGINNIDVTLFNYGLINLSSASISGYITNGTTTVNFGPISYAGSPILPQGSAAISLGSFNFISGSYSLVAWSTNPNNSTDANILNDTLKTSICVGLSGVYTIGAGGTFPTFASAISSLSCGVTGPVIFNVLPKASPYNEQLLINQIPNTSATNTITFNGGNNTISFAPTATNRYVIRLDGADHITFNDFIVVSTASLNSFGILLNNEANFNTINNCTIDLTATFANTGTTNAGIVISGSDISATTAGPSGTNNTISNTTIKGGYYGITIFGASTTANSVGNTISNCIIEDFYFYGIYVSNFSNSNIMNNSIRRPTRTTLSTFYGIYHTTSGQNTKIAGNKIHDAFTGVVVTNTSASYPISHSNVDATFGNENLVYNNLIYNINNNGSIYAIYNSGSDYVKYHHNTISLDHAASTSGLANGFYQTATAVGIDFRNNIISVTRGGTGVKYCLYFNTPTSTIICNNNILYLNAPSGTNSIGYFGSAQASLPLWQSVNSAAYDQNSFAANPQYTNQATNNFIPTNFTLDNQGVPLGVLTDHAGATRNLTTPDIGAYEFSQPINDVQISNIKTSLEPCFTSGDVLNVDIKNTLLSTLDFSVQNLTINWSITGPITLSGTATINTGTLAPGITITLPIVTGIDFSAIGTYNVQATVTSSWDDIPGNNHTTRNITVNAVTASASVTTECLGGSFNLNLTGYTGQIQWQKDTGSGFVNITGATTNQIAEVLTGNTNYRAVYCTNNLNSNTVTVNASIPAPPITTNDTVCAGQNATVKAASSLVISWYDAPTGGNLLGTGNNLQLANLLLTTTVYAQTNDGTPLNCMSARIPADAVADQIPVVTLPNDTTFCQGGMILLDAGAGSATYAWSTGANTQSIQATTSGKYIVTAWTSFGCSISDSVEITVNPLPVVAITASNNPICFGDQVTMTASGATTYNWDTGSSNTTITITPSATTNYSVIGTDANNCNNTAEITITVNPLPIVTLVNFEKTCINFPAFLLTGGSPSTGTYLIPSGANTHFDPKAAGIGFHNITYTYTDGKGCTGSASNYIEVSPCTSIEESNVQNLNFKVFPNPANNHFAIQVTAMEKQAIEVYLLDSNGKQVIKETISMDAGTNNVEFNTALFARGIYILKIITDGNVYNQRVVLN